MVVSVRSSRVTLWIVFESCQPAFGHSEALRLLSVFITLQRPSILDPDGRVPKLVCA